MNIKIVAVGKLKDPSLIELSKEYVKRISTYAKVEIIEVADEKEPNNPSPNDELNCRIKEGERLLSKIKDNEYVFLLDLVAPQFDSIEFSNKIDKLMTNGKSTITFVIGGSTGLSDDVRKRANERISLSKMTFTHLMTRVLVLEQLYRAFTIINHKIYHK